MTHAPNPSPVQASAPDIARRVGLIVAAIAALVAHRFLRDPRLIPLTIPLWTRLTHAASRFERLIARFAAGRLRRPRPMRPHRPTLETRTPETPTPEPTRPAAFPTGHAWLIRAIPYEAAAYASQLEHLLAEPATVELLAACPQAMRILSPIGRMLGLAAFAPKRRARKPRPQAAAPRAAKPPSPFDKHKLADPTYRPSADWPRGPWPQRRPPTPWLTALLLSRAKPA